MTEPLSPAAQAILDAAHNRWLDVDDDIPAQVAAAALKAAADQVAPETELPQRSDFPDWSLYQWAIELHAYDDSTRRKLLAIAAELEGVDD